jgi:hypothetical protein
MEGVVGGTGRGGAEIDNPDTTAVGARKRGEV